MTHMKRCRPYTSLFLDMNTKFFKLCETFSRTRPEDQFLYAEVQSIFVPPHFWQVPLTSFTPATALG